MRPFVPHPLLKQPDLMTLVPRYWPRPGLLRGMPTETRLFAVSPRSRILGYCHWQPDMKSRPALILVHGLEGCSESPYMLGTASKAWRAGFNVIRLNQRNCGGTEHLTPTLYHSGLSNDLSAVVKELSQQDGIEAIWLAGYSMGGNLVLRMGGEIGADLPALQGLITVCPTIDPTACVQALERRRNWVYQRFFLRSLQARVRRKAGLFPGKFDLTHLARIQTLRAFDDVYTALDGGFLHAADYYERSGARHVLGQIAVPTLILTSHDDPFIPYRIFQTPALATNPWIHLVAPAHGGHCGFIQRRQSDEDRFWAENRLVEFITTTNLKKEDITEEVNRDGRQCAVR
ncbi:MAG TPA: alpha/beta fold hydrolase [Nitrospiraceae bacterium]|nr:alpha/beta fold hydrolase [Nitrospiraceae bacterium]